jgi:hypothetical protein
MQSQSIASPAQALYRQRACLAALQGRLLQLAQTVGRPADLPPSQWAQLVAMLLEFRSDLILDLGRGFGNSTCAFAEVAHQLGGASTCRVLSLCLSDVWHAHSLPRLEKVVPASWFTPLAVTNADILDYPFEPVLAASARTAVFWDAHGFEMASCVLGKILPSIQHKPHLVLIHGLSDVRYAPEGSRFYDGQPLWTGNAWNGARVRLGHVETAVEDAVAALDFTARNRIPLHSAEHSYRAELTPEQMGELRDALGDQLFSLSGPWFYFSLNEAPPPYTFPVHERGRPLRAVTSLAPDCDFQRLHLDFLLKEHERLLREVEKARRRPWARRAWVRWKRSYRKRVHRWLGKSGDLTPLGGS